MPRRTQAAAKPLPFDQRLVLNQWFLSLFEVKDFETLAGWLKDLELEGYDEENVSRFHRQLTLRLFEPKHLPHDLLLAYDANIVRHWQRITQKRAGQTLYMKDFQYLALLLTEIFLDRYFKDREALAAAVNRQIISFNQDKAAADALPPTDASQLNKLAYWMATGSGKTLLMHCNVLQFLHYSRRDGQRNKLNRIILLTPNEGLSRQHLEEFELSGVQAELFQKDGRGLFSGQSVEIIDIHKLKEDQGQKTVAIDAFEGNNLVLVDEGHRGASGEDWMATRNRLCEDGFSFEYSATFGQAMKASKNKSLTDDYARWILFDYSYRRFYGDGYGKDYRILNLADDDDSGARRLYLTACLLMFYQQTRLFLDKETAFSRFLLERPLWVFVGSSVNAVRSENKRQVSDVVDILLFVRDFVRDRTRTIGDIQRLLENHAGLHDQAGRDIFANSFPHLVAAHMDPEDIFRDILSCVFNAETDGALHVEDLKSAQGEVSLRIADYEPFGVINVGDSARLVKLCNENGLNVSDKEFVGSLFYGINDRDSTVRLLIGSKKFTEGWSSWRVSTMGLMHVGKSEGSEIIQLFGRGVRLKGHEFGLKRSGYVVGIERPDQIGLLETLNVVGVRADYMQQFRQYLEDEGLSPDKDAEEILIPTVQLDVAGKKLRTVKLKDGVDFKRDGSKPALAPMEDLRRHPLVVDWYPRIQATASAGVGVPADRASKHEGKLGPKHLAFIDFEALWFDLHRFKNERAWFNFDLPRNAPRELMEAGDWYRLYIPEQELEFRDFERVRRWQEIAGALLTKYCDRFYKQSRSAFEYDQLEYRELTPDDPNFFAEYQLLVQRSENAVIETMKQIKTDMAAGILKDYSVGNFQSIQFGRHLYGPLLHIKSSVIEVKPVALNEGERDFVLGIRDYWFNHKELFEDKELYLLRNRSRSGIGFFEAGNFYPDFIVWLLAGKQQHVTFVDPKGIRNLDGPEDPKIRFYQTIKDLEKKLGDPDVTLESFILSVTPYSHGGWWTDSLDKPQLAMRHVLFAEDGLDSLIGRILTEMSSL